MSTSDSIRELSNEHIRALIIDDEDHLELLRDRLELPTLDYAIKREWEESYTALLEHPFSYDVLFVDYRLDLWPLLPVEFSSQWGLPDSVGRGRLFEAAIASNEDDQTITRMQEERAVVGGHCELLIQLATRHDVLIIATSFHDEWTVDPVPQLRALGAHFFLPKQGEELDIQQAQALVRTLGASRRDRRLWGALSPAETKLILAELQTSDPDAVRQRIREYADVSPSKRDEDCLSSGSPAKRTAYLIKTLGWLREPRLNCTQHLLDEADAACAEGDLAKASRLFSMCVVLQPTIPAALAPQETAEGAVTRQIDLDVQSAYARHNLSEDTEYVHLSVGAGVKRVDFYSSKRLKNDGRTHCDYLGTSFSPRLAAAVDRSGVWPPRSLSKLRHLLRGPREARLYHQAGAIVRSGAGAFGPTIDTYLAGDVLRTLARREEICLDHVVELGLGTGHLSSVLLVNAGDQVKSLSGSEVSAPALARARENIAANCRAFGLEPALQFERRPDYLKNLPPCAVDLIISNPPYLPTPHYAIEGEPSDSATAGEELINHILVDEGPRVLKPNGAVVLVTSTLTRSTVDNARTVAKRRGIDWHVRKLRSLMWVPLDLPEVLEDPSWLKHLLDKRALEVYFDLAAVEFPLRHGIEVRVFSRSPAVADAFVKAIANR